MFALLLFLAMSATSPAAEIGAGWRLWWLPPNHSVHGSAIDAMFRCIFWITISVAVGVEAALIGFSIRFRRRDDGRRAHFIHGNRVAEMLWTFIPIAIFAMLAIGSQRVWNNYRSPTNSTSSVAPATVLVIGQQFQWNYIYPGPDGKLGRYLVYPKPTDLAWPNNLRFHNVHGPAELSAEAAKLAIDDYIATVNPLGKDFADPNGADDNFAKFPGRPLILPRGRPIVVRLASKDVIHDFFLPNFRVKLDAVPGLLGEISFETTGSMPTSVERESQSRHAYDLDELSTKLADADNRRLTIAIGEADATNGATRDPVARQWLFKDADGTIIRDGQPLRDLNEPLRKINRLRAIGVRNVTAYQPGDWDLVCNQLCGVGHTTMQGTVRFVTNEEFDAMKFDRPSQIADARTHEIQRATQ